MRDRIKNLDDVKRIVVFGSNHMDTVIGTGSKDPEKYSPDASRETLDHSLMYILAVALEDGTWDYIKSYTPERSHRPDTIRLWEKIATAEDPAWTKRYHDPDPAKAAAGGRIEITMNDGSVVADQIANANAYNYGATPWGRNDYIQKFQKLASESLDQSEIDRFIDIAERLADLRAQELARLYPKHPEGRLAIGSPGLF